MGVPGVRLPRVARLPSQTLFPRRSHAWVSSTERTTTAGRTPLTNLFTISIDELWDVPVAEARGSVSFPCGQKACG